MPAAENKRAVRRMFTAFNTGNLDIVDEIVSSDLKDLTPFPATRPNAEGLKKQIVHIRKAFPDVKFSVEMMLAEGEKIALRWKMVGTQRGEFLGHPPSNKKVEHFGSDFITFRRGKMVEHRSSDNNRALLQRLGHDPRPRPEKMTF
jgi:predicted ester cyclase